MNASHTAWKCRMSTQKAARATVGLKQEAYFHAPGEARKECCGDAFVMSWTDLLSWPYFTH